MPVALAVLTAVSARGHEQNSAGPADGSDLTAGQIVDRVKEAYAGWTTYSAEGETRTDMTMSDSDRSSLIAMPLEFEENRAALEELAQGIHGTRRFKIRFAEPNLYLIQWD